MFIVDEENGIALNGSAQPLGIRCHCGHRALIPQDRLPPKIGAGSVVKLRDQNWKCSICGGRRVELVMFWNTVQSLAFSDGEPYRTVWSLRLHGKDTTEEPWCRYADEPNPCTDDDPEIPAQHARPVSRWKAEDEAGAIPRRADVDAVAFASIRGRSYLGGALGRAIGKLKSRNIIALVESGQVVISACNGFARPGRWQAVACRGASHRDRLISIKDRRWPVTESRPHGGRAIGP